MSTTANKLEIKINMSAEPAPLEYAGPDGIAHPEGKPMRCDAMATFIGQGKAMMGVTEFGATALAAVTAALRRLADDVEKAEKNVVVKPVQAS